MATPLLRRSAPTLAAVGLALLCARAPAAPAGTANHPARCERAAISADIARETMNLYRTQLSDGALSFQGTQSLYKTNPIQATL